MCMYTYPPPTHFAVFPFIFFSHLLVYSCIYEISFSHYTHTLTHTITHTHTHTIIHTELQSADGSLNAVLESPKVEGSRRRPRWKWSPISTQILTEAFKKVGGCAHTHTHTHTCVYMGVVESLMNDCSYCNTDMSKLYNLQ